MNNNTLVEIQKKKQAIQDCIKKYDLPENPAITDEILTFEGFPNKPTEKLAVLILTYNREATNTELQKISPQPAALITQI